MPRIKRNVRRQFHWRKNFNKSSNKLLLFRCIWKHVSFETSRSLFIRMCVFGWLELCCWWWCLCISMRRVSFITKKTMRGTTEWQAMMHLMYFSAMLKIIANLRRARCLSFCWGGVNVTCLLLKYKKEMYDIVQLIDTYTPNKWATREKMGKRTKHLTQSCALAKCVECVFYDVFYQPLETYLDLK